MTQRPRYLVTGGAGFVGSNLVDALVARGERVRVLDDFSTGRRENLTAAGDAVELIEGDIRQPDACREAMAGIEYVFHQAALASVTRSVEDPVNAHAVNAGGTLNLLVAAREAEVRRFIYASSSAVYGTSGALPRREDQTPEPLSPYAASKLAAELYATVFYDLHGLETVSLRYFNVFGPRQDEKSQYAAVVPAFINSLLAGEPPVIYGNGEQSRDFTFVENVVEANLMAATASGAAGQVMNVACGDRFTLNELLRRLQEITSCHVNPRFAPERPGDVPHSQADIGRARRIMNYHPRISFDEGLRRTVEWFRSR